MKLVEYLLDGGTLFDVTYTWPEWLTSDIRTGVESLAMDYALRTIQPRVQLLSELTDNDLEDVIQLQVKNRILRNDYKYRTLLATESFEYNPIENYNMTESGTDGHTKGQQINSDLLGHSVTRTFADTNTQTLNNSDTLTHNNSDTLTLNTSDARTTSASISGTSGSTEGARSDSTTESVYGYNSSTAVPSKETGFSKGSQTNSGSSSSQSSGSDTLLRTGTETTAHSGTETTAHSGTVADAHTGTIADAYTGTDTHTDGQRIDSSTHSLTRSGNIGTVTAQDMIIQQREIADFSFMNILTRDLINSFCLGVM